MIRITASVDGKPAFDRAFLKVEATFDDFTPVFEEAGEQLLEFNEDQFQSAGAAGGTPWQPLTDDYARWKALHSSWGALIDLSTLRLSDKMMRSLTKRGADGNVWEVGKREAAFGSTNPLAGYHHRGEGRLPAREIIVLNEQRRTQLMKRSQKRLVAELRETGLIQRTAEF